MAEGQPISDEMIQPKKDFHVGNMAALREQVVGSGSGITIKPEHENSEPELWNKLSGLHQDVIREGKNMLMDTAGNIVFQRITTENAQK